MIEPYQQGEFDALCGIYAIINASRKALGHDQRLPDAAWEALFASLIEQIDERVGLAVAMSDGLATMEMLGLVRFAAAVVRQEHGRNIEVCRPLLRSRKPSLAVCINQLRDYAEQKDTAILTGLGGTLGHWTVIDRISHAYLGLFDSGGYRRVRISRCRMGHEAPIAGKTEHIIKVGAVILISYVGCMATKPS